MRFLIALLILLLPTLSSGQTKPDETRCLTALELNRVTDHLCERARAKEIQYDRLREVSDAYLVRAVSAEAKLEEYREVDLRRVELEKELAVVKASTVPKSHVILVVVGGFVVGAGVGTLIGLAL